MTADARTIAGDLGFVEGPTLLPSGGLVVVSLDHQRLYDISKAGQPGVLVEMEAAPNGSTVGADAAVYLTAFSGAWPARPECTGAPGVFVWRGGTTVDVIATAPAAPNDLCFGPDGCLYVTDPVRGQNSGRLWRIDAETGAGEVLAMLDWYPNGIGFDAGDNLWVADTVGRRLICLEWRGGDLGDQLAVIALRQGKPDGFAFDVQGNIVVAAPRTPERPASSVMVIAADGRLADVLLDDESAYYTNVALAGDGTTYITDAQQGRVLVLDGACPAGLPMHPFR